MRAANNPVFIVCNARSGSTLLGYILDSHPDVMCPSESMLIRMALEYASASTEAQASARSLVLDVLDGARRVANKSWCCYKDLSNIDYLQFIQSLFPDAKYVFLHRHCMDLIASGLEAARWDLKYFGFFPYIARNSGNLVAAVAEYWLTRTRKMLEFQGNPECASISIRYEDLVTTPADVISEILGFIGVKSTSHLIENMTQSAVFKPRKGLGEDPKIRFKSSIGSESIGRGRTIPAALITGALRADINSCLRTMRYDIINDNWNSAGDSDASRSDGFRRNAPRTDVEQLVPILLHAPGLPASLSPGSSIEIIATGDRGTRARWWLDPKTSRWREGEGGDGVEFITVTTRREVLRELLLGRLKVDAAIRWNMFDITPKPDCESWRTEKFIGAMFDDLSSFVIGDKS